MDEFASSSHGTPGNGTGDYRTRRPHKKSRYGCTRCRGRKIKCDELKPRCSRCNKMDLACLYSKQNHGSTAPGHRRTEPADRDPLLLPLEVPGTDGGLDSPSSEPAGRPSPSATSVQVSSSPPLPAGALPKRDPPLRLHRAQTLTPTEFALLQHYLEHTSRDPTVDDGDRYTLQIGIPNLACRSKPLMSSVLAIAAVCKCCDIIGQPRISQGCRGQVLELLSLADRYHMESLREIQAALPEAKHYDHVLANAAMMGMYGSASHRTRIWLATTATPGDQSLSDFMPKHSQWVSLFRAVSVAYAGLLNNAPRTDGMLQINPASPPVDPVESTGIQTQYKYRVSSLRQQPQPPLPNHALHPILAATVGSALARLHEKAREAAIVQTNLEGGGHHDSETPTHISNPGLRACFAALSLLDSIVAEIFPAGESKPNIPDRGHLAFEVDVDPAGRLSKVSPWLRRYTAGITSIVPSRLPRRTIMAFVHKIPTDYLILVEEIFNLIQPEAPGGDEVARGSSAGTTPEPTMGHQLAAEIFAHWLVLVILLDNVWWIGGIGAWELGRFVTFFRKDAQWLQCLWNKDEDWWPESMFQISRQFDKHRAMC